MLFTLMALYLCLSILSPCLPFPILLGQRLTLLFRLSFQLVCCSLFFRDAPYPLAVVDHKNLRESHKTRPLAALLTQRVVSENHAQLDHVVILYLLLYPLLCPRHYPVLSLHR